MNKLNILELIILAPVILLALTVHEYAHARVAYFLGDPTAKSNGRLTLNPLSHLDFLGTVFLFLFHFGWAKPVPVNPLNFKNPKEGMVYTGIAGPFSNLALAFILGLFLRVLLKGGFVYNGGSVYWAFLLSFLILSVEINIALALFNLIPLPPLDGSRLVEAFVKDPIFLSKFYRYGSIILLMLIAVDIFTNTGIFSFLLWKPVSMLVRAFTGYSRYELYGVLTGIISSL